MVKRSDTVWLLVALAAGLALGILLRSQDAAAAEFAIAIADPVGTLWVNAIRMTVIPLVVATVLAAVVAPDARILFARLGWRAAALLLALALVISALSVIVAQTAFGWLALGEAREAAAQLTQQAAAPSAAPSMRDWVVGLIPTNPVKAAADGMMLPLLVFTVAFGLAAAGLPDTHRERLSGLAVAISEATMRLVRAVLYLAPLGVFALAVVLAARLGADAVGSLGLFVVVVVVLCVAAVALFYPLVGVASTSNVRDFAAASAPGQAVAFSARTSLAALPAMLEGVRARLNLHRELPDVFLPISASIFRPGSAVAIPVGVLFLAKLYGVDLGPMDLASIAVLSALLTFSVPSVPGGTILIMAPVLAAARIPAEGIGILLALDAIPDMFRTTANVTGHMAAITILDRWAGPPPSGTES